MQRPGSDVTLLQREGKRRPSIFVDCVAMTGVVSAEYTVVRWATCLP